MDFIVQKSQIIKIGSLSIVALLIFICYFLDVGFYESSTMSSSQTVYFTYTAKMRIEIMGTSITIDIEDCNGEYFCQVVKQAPIYGSIDLAIAIIIVLIEILSLSVLKDKVKPDLLKNLVLIGLVLGLVFALLLMFQFWFAAIGSDIYKLCAGSQICIVLYNLLFGFACFVQFKAKSGSGQETLLT
ncbi:unnamed protein product [Paramecium sonneborni]|uniref:Transmembrane protein n=1 Tax=Paramecium sonneborni TaxID=65129 RepID=A0A8S1MLR3_9CILI|nr:unnamed protein product [Paramecium sonneborni]